MHIRLDHNDLEIDMTVGATIDCLASLPRQLQKLDLSYNHYSKLPAALLPLEALIELNLNNNRIVAIDGSYMYMYPLLIPHPCPVLNKRGLGRDWPTGLARRAVLGRERPSGSA